MKSGFLRALMLALALGGVGAAPAVAQVGYFGQNKIQYRDFKFRVMKTQHFDVYYYPEEADAATMAGRMAERWYTRLSSIFGHQLKNRQPLILYGSASDFRQTNVIEGSLGEGTGGVTEAYKRRIVLPFAGPIASTDHVLGHEIVHAFQYDISSVDASRGGASGALTLPLWFIEGMAEYLSIGPVDPNTAMWMREATRREQLPDIDDLNNPKYFPYRYGQALWAFIAGKYGDQAVGSLLRAGIARRDYRQAFEQVLGVTSKQLSTQWHDATFAAYRPVAEVTRMPRAFARPVIVKEDPDNPEINVSPEISPDGTRLVFFSSRDLFSIDLYLADAKTGKVIRKLTDTATNSHYDSLQFIESAGAWSPDGRRFAFPGLSAGRPVLTIVDVDTGDKVQEIKLNTLAEVLNPAWSPDGRQIAFSALIGGFNDLFVYDLEQKQLRRLTTDHFAELDPSWSPDGRSLVFSSDRFGASAAAIDPSNLRLASIDLGSGAIREVGGFDDAKNIDPQWSGDGSTLYFLSDHGGVTNVYRMDANGGTPQPLTNLLTGVSGITDLSPALSASKTGLVFSAYEEDGYNIYAMDAPGQAATRVAELQLPSNAGVLPPRRVGEGEVYAMLHDEQRGLPAVAEFPSDEYHPKLSLDYLGQPMVGVGVDSFGTYVGGGISAVFSDMLGNHVVAGDLFLTNRFDETGGSAMYLNRTHRWTWGGAFDQTPYVLRGFQATAVQTPGGQLIQEDELRQIQVERGFSGIAMYPLSRAQRVEFSGGLRQISGKTDVTTRLFDPFTGQQLSEDKRTLSSFPTLNLAQASGALVYDTSIFGATSPIRGSRYRFEYDQTSGSLTYGSALADYRTYLMPVRPFTIALRGIFYGRYGRDAEDSLLQPLFIGYQELVRGYDFGSFEARECGNAQGGACPVLDNLIGSRMAVANAELRFPLWGAFGGSNFYGPIPVELAVFGDAGIAWDRSNSNRFTDAERELVKSVGVAARINLLGFAVAEIDYVRPLDRPLKGWMWQFNLTPGF